MFLLNWAAQNLRLGRGLDIATLDKVKLNYFKTSRNLNVPYTWTCSSWKVVERSIAHYLAGQS